jgi:2'-5' RNA ligase
MNQNQTNPHQQKQIEVINSLEKQIKTSSLNFTTVSPVEDYANDTRICLTSVHFPNQELIAKVQHDVIEPLKQIFPDNYYYPDDSLHMTIKNVRIINDPPHFTNADVKNVEQVFESVIQNHKKFDVYFYRLLLFPNNLALIGTTDPELDSIILNLDKELHAAGVADDKKYLNSQYFFSNMTLVRFNNVLSEEFTEKVEELSQSILFEPYTVDSVTLITGNAVFVKKNIINSWKLKEA